MTHDELLMELSSTNRRYGGTKDNSALRSVIKLHTYVLTGKRNRGKAGLSKRCTECGFAYPCPTIQVIEKELG